MKRYLLTLAAFSSMILSGAVLVENGRANAEIILPQQANPVELFAAKELATHLKILSGVELPVLETPTDTARVTIRLGRAAKNLPLSGQPKNAGHIRVEGNAIAIAGIDDNGDPMKFDTATGTLFAVYDFLEGLGVRWLWPGDLGTYAPQKTTISIDDADRTVAAPLPTQGWRISYCPMNWPNQAEAKTFYERERLWLRRHRFTAVVSLAYGHAFTQWFGKYGKSNPEFFNLLPDGTRRPEPIGPFPNRPDLVSMCVSNPDLTRKIVEEWVAKGNGPIINLNENDTAGKCVCPACLTADGSKDEERLTRAQKRFAAGDGKWFRELGSVSERYAHWYLHVLGEADRVAPEAKAKVISGIYANYFEPPTNVRLNDRVILRFCPPLMYPWTPEKVATFKRLWKGWSDAGVRLMLRPNFTLDGHGFPLLYYRDFIECFDFAYANGMIAADLDSLTGMFGANGLTTYAIAEKFSSPHKTADDIMEEYLMAFGPAAPAIRKYIALMETATRNGRFAEAFSIEGGRYADFYQVAPQIFKPETMKRGAELLDEAARLAAQDATAAAHVRFVRLGFDDAAMVLATQEGFEEFKKTGNANPFVTAIKKLQAHRAAHEEEGYANIGVLTIMEERNWPLHLALLGNDSFELKNWEIRFDPKRDGEAAGCLEGRGDGWQPIVLDRHWELSEPGKAWEKAHGAPHKGLAWYRCRFKFPETNLPKLLKLTFGAVDGNADIWLNGTHICTHNYPYKGDRDSWKKPFDVDTRNTIRTGENLLIVRIDKKINGLSGIWRPVFLSAGSVQPENLSAAGWKVNLQTGRFSIQSRKYPLTIAATDADTTKLNVYRGVWGRLYRTETVIPNQCYKVQCTYRTSPECKGTLSIWLRSGKGSKLNQANVNLNAPSTNGEWRTIAVRVKTELDTCTILLNLIHGIGEVQIRECTISPTAEFDE